MNEKISIIIPVYQVEAYLPKCLNSIIRQTYKNLEIILIDDGSKDQCGRICDEYARKDSRIRVIHKQNEGVANARNDGIKYATGDFISFIDSDDWIAANAYQVLYRGLKKYDADCAVGGCINVVEKNGKCAVQRNRKRGHKPSAVCESSSQAMKRVLLNGSAVWNRLFKREVFDTIRFPSDRINDDEVVALHAYAECKKVVFLNQDTYFYRIRKNSITTSSFSLKKMDIYYNSMDNLAFVRESRPELAVCAEFKYYKAMLYCYIHLKGMKRSPQSALLLKRLKQDIRKNQAMAMKNPYLLKRYKFLMKLCAI